MSPARVLAVALVVASTARAGNYSLGGSIGGGGLLLNEWSPAGGYMASTLDFDADASFSGSPFRPGLLQFLLGGRYRTLHSLYVQGGAATQSWGFHVNLAGLSQTVLPVQLFASRDWSDFISDLGSHRTGASTVTTLGAGTQLLVRGFPSLRLSVLRNMIENNSFGTPPTVAETTAVSAGAAYSIGTQTYSASYDTAWNSGTWAENNYHSHAVTLAATASPANGINLRLSERYYLRLPLNNDPTNPRIDDNAFNVGVVRPSATLTTAFDYGYRHVLVSAPQALQIEQSSHAVNNSTAVHLTPHLDATGNAGVVVTSEALGAARLSGESEHLGLGLIWTRKFSRWMFNAGGGGTLGLTEPSIGGLLIGYGGSASLGGTGSWERVSGNASYTISYQRNLAGVPGWTLFQNANLNVQSFFKGVLAKLALLATGSRRTDALLGTFVGQSVSMALGASWRRYTVALSGGLSNGISDALANPVLSEGLFLPAPYNTQTRYATLTAGASFDSGRLYLGLILRTLDSVAPGRAEQYENGASLTASYTLGAFTFSFEERFSDGGVGGNWQRGNLAMLRITRSFGWGF